MAVIPSRDSASAALELEQGIDLHKHIDVLRKWKWLILGVVVVVTAATALWTFSCTRIYRANAAVLITKATPEILGDHVKEVVNLARESYWDTEQYLQNQVSVACGTAVATRAAKQLNLVGNPRFWSVLGEDRAYASYSLSDAASMLLASASCTPRRKATILDISIEHPDPALAGQLANALARAFIEQNLDYKLSSTVGASEWLAKQLDELRGQLERAERSLYEFKRKNNLLAVPLSGQQNLLTRQVEQLNEELGRARIRRMSLATQLAELRSLELGDPLSLPAGPLLDNEIVDRLKMTYIEERRKFTTLKERYLERHPLVIEQQTRMQAAGEDVRREVKNRINGLAALHEQSVKHEAQLAAAIQHVKEEALELGQKEQTYQQLKRPLDTTSKLYDVLLSRMKESDISGQLRLNNMSLLEPASGAGLVRPRVRLNLLVGAVLGLLFAVGMAFLLEILDSSVRSEEDVSHMTGLVCLGAVPSVKNQVKDSNRVHPVLARSPAMVVHHRPMSVPAEAWRAVRTNLLFSSPDRTVKTIVITSASPREGKTTIAVGLASAVAQAGERVLLIDADMRRPQLHTIFELGKGRGLTSALRGDAEASELIRTTEVPNLFVLPCGALPPNPAELCQSERLLKLVEKIGEQFDRVFIDSPPVMLVTDPVLLAARFDAAILVVRTDKTPRKLLQDCHRQISEVGGHVLGCVLNDVDVRQQGYRYYPYRKRAYRLMGDHGYPPATEDEQR